MIIEAKVSIIWFNPKWNAVIGPAFERGEGLMSKSVFGNRHLIDAFTVTLPDYSLVIKPKEGKIFTDNALDIVTLPGTVFWSRVMQKQYGGEASGSTPELVAYIVGIENAQGKHGYTVRPDGVAFKGVN